MRQFFKLILSIAIICVAQQITYAQNTEKETTYQIEEAATFQIEKETTYQIKTYYNFVHSSFEFGPTTEEQPRVFEFANTDFGYITPAFTIVKKQMRHEIELSAFRVKRDRDFEGVTEELEGYIIPVEGSRDWRVNIGLRYEFAFNLLQEKLRHGLFVGASAEPYFDYWNFLPATSADFPTNDRVFGTRLHLIPRYTFDISRRWFVDVNFPIEMMDAFVHRSYSGNPTLSERVGIDTQANFFDKVFRFRIGIGLKL